MSILLKQDPISTTSPITGGSPNSNKSELTELKTEVSDLHTQLTGFQTLMTNMHEESKAREERDRQDRLERDRREREDKKEREEKDREFKRELQILQMQADKKARAHQLLMAQEAKQRDTEMRAFFQSMMGFQKHVPIAIQPGSMVTSPLTSLNSGNNSSNKRVCNDQSVNDPSQQLTTAENGGKQ